MTTHEAAAKAADLIEERGWWDGKASTEGNGGRLCVMQAFDNVQDNHWDIVAFRAWLNKGPLERWNDAQPNGEAVIRKLREFAALGDKT